MHKTLQVVGTFGIFALWLSTVACVGDDDTSRLEQVIESQSSQIAGLQTALAPTLTPVATATPALSFQEVEAPLFRDYARAVGAVGQLMPQGGASYSFAVETPELQAAFDTAFRRAQEILRSTSSFVNSPDRDCVNAVQEWSRFATDYWNSLATAASAKVPTRWTYAITFEKELLDRQQRMTSKCPALITSLAPSSTPMQ